ncbi:MAG TPA: hypothetical protein VKB91_12565 [Gemmatimonadaceae bacterium]|nr:hypothetical protein [Gemmatimonadaceae bacterium]
MTEKGASPPEELATAMRNALGNNPNPTAPEVLEAAERLLDRVLRTDCETRESALELLTVDALMTSALELAAKDAKLMEKFPEQAMQRVASHGRDPS